MTSVAENMISLRGEIEAIAAERERVIGILAGGGELSDINGGLSRRAARHLMTSWQRPDGEPRRLRMQNCYLRPCGWWLDRYGMPKPNRTHLMRRSALNAVCQNIGREIYAQTRAAQQQAREYTMSNFAEAQRLRSQPNATNLAGRQRHLDDLRERVDAARSGLHSKESGSDYSSGVFWLKEKERELATAEARDRVFLLRESTIPAGIAEPGNHRHYRRGQRIAPSDPLEQQGDVFGQVAAAFKEANPAECLAECRRIMDGWKEAAKSSDEQEAAAGK